MPSIATIVDVVAVVVIVVGGVGVGGGVVMAVNVD